MAKVDMTARDEQVLVAALKKLPLPEALNSKPGDRGFRVVSIQPYQLAGKSDRSGMYGWAPHGDPPYPTDLTRAQVKDSMDRLVEAGRLKKFKGYGAQWYYTTPEMFLMGEDDERLKEEERQDRLRRLLEADNRLIELGVDVPLRERRSDQTYSLETVEGLLKLLDEVNTGATAR